MLGQRVFPRLSVCWRFWNPTHRPCLLQCVSGMFNVLIYYFILLFVSSKLVRTDFEYLNLYRNNKKDINYWIIKTLMEILLGFLTKLKFSWAREFFLPLQKTTDNNCKLPSLNACLLSHFILGRIYSDGKFYFENLVYITAFLLESKKVFIARCLSFFPYIRLHLILTNRWKTSPPPKFLKYFDKILFKCSLVTKCIDFETFTSKPSD